MFWILFPTPGSYTRFANPKLGSARSHLKLLPIIKAAKYNAQRDQ